MIVWAIGMILYFGGVAILWAQHDWPTALAVMMLVGGNNIGIAMQLGRGRFTL